MLDFLKNWSLNIVTIVLFMTMVEMIAPTSKFRKYINLATGIIVVIAILSPLLSINNEISLPDYLFQSASILDRNQLEAQKSLAQEEQRRLILGEYKRNLEERARFQALQVLGNDVECKAEVTVVEDPDAKNYGAVREVRLHIKNKAASGEYGTDPENETGGNTVRSVVNIQQVQIDPIISDYRLSPIKHGASESVESFESGVKSGGWKISGIDERAVNLLKEKLSVALDIDSDQVEITGGDN